MAGQVQVGDDVKLSTPKAIRHALTSIGEWCTRHQSLRTEVDQLEEFVSILVPQRKKNTTAWPTNCWFTDTMERLEMRVAHTTLVQAQDDSMLSLVQRLRDAIQMCYMPPKLPIPHMPELWHLIPELVTTPTQLLFILNSLRSTCKAYMVGVKEAGQLGKIIAQLEHNRQLAKPSQAQLEQLISLHERLNAMRREILYSGRAASNIYELFLALIISSVRIYSLRGWWTPKDTVKA